MAYIGVVSLVMKDDENQAAIGTGNSDDGSDSCFSCDDAPCDCDCDCHDCIASDD